MHSFFTFLKCKHITRRSSTHTSCAGQFVSRSFVVLLRKIFSQNRNLQTAAELGVRRTRFRAQGEKMNGPIVHNIALCLYGNAYVFNDYDISDFWSNSVNQFCKDVSFIKFKSNLFGKVSESVFAKNPIEWFKIIKEKNAHLYLWHQGTGRIDERFMAGFIGGGGNWNIISNQKSINDVFTAQWTVENQNEPDQRIWKVKYGLVDTNKPIPEVNDGYLEYFLESLVKISDFAYKNDCSNFGKCFENAISTIESKGKTLFGYHKDLVPKCYRDQDINYILDACQSAWVFGGMGSWNDIGFSGEIQQEYELVSERLYSSLINVIVNSVNEIRLTTAST